MLFKLNKIKFLDYMNYKNYLKIFQKIKILIVNLIKIRKKKPLK